MWWGPQAEADSIETVLAAIDAGAAFIDTAPFYGWGRAERLVGEALRRTDRRPPVFTKCGTVRRGLRIVEDGSRDAVRADVFASLERLGVDRVELVQLHDPDPATPIETTWAALMELHDEALIDDTGLSNQTRRCSSGRLEWGRWPRSNTDIRYCTADQSVTVCWRGLVIGPCRCSPGHPSRAAFSPTGSISRHCTPTICGAGCRGRRANGTGPSERAMRSAVWPKFATPPWSTSQ